MVPLVAVSALSKVVHIDTRTSGAITAGDFAKVDAAAAAVRAGGASAPFTADRGETRGALEWIQIWATSPTLGFAKADRRAYAAKVYTELAGRPPADTPGIVAASNGPTANTNSGGILDTLSGYITRVTQGPSQNIGAAAGAAAGEKVKGTIVLVGALLAAALVVAVVLIKRR